MGHGHRGGRGATKKPPDNTKKKQKNLTSTKLGTSSESSDSDHSRKSQEDHSKAADLDTVRTQHEVEDEIFKEDSARNKEVSDKPNHENVLRRAFLSAPGDEQCSNATTITKQVKQTAPVKRRRQSLDDEQSIRDEIFQSKSFEEQTIIVVNNLSAEITKSSKAIRGEIKSLNTAVGSKNEKIFELENTVTNMANKIETLNATITELKTESRNGHENALDLVTAVKALSTKVEDQNKTINGLITGKVDLKDTTDIQNKIDEVMKAHLKSLSETVVKQAERGVKVTQSRCNDIFTVANKLLNGHDRVQKDRTRPETKNDSTGEEEVLNLQVSSSNYATLNRNSSGANHDGSHNNHNQKLQIDGLRPGRQPPPKSYSNVASTHLPPGLPPIGPKYNQKQNNRGTFDNLEAEGPNLIRKDYPVFTNGNLRWQENWEKAKPPLTESPQKESMGKRHGENRYRSNRFLNTNKRPPRKNPLKRL